MHAEDLWGIDLQKATAIWIYEAGHLSFAFLLWTIYKEGSFSSSSYSIGDQRRPAYQFTEKYT